MDNASVQRKLADLFDTIPERLRGNIRNTGENYTPALLFFRECCKRLKVLEKNTFW